MCKGLTDIPVDWYWVPWSQLLRNMLLPTTSPLPVGRLLTAGLDSCMYLLTHPASLSSCTSTFFSHCSCGCSQLLYLATMQHRWKYVQKHPLSPHRCAGTYVSIISMALQIAQPTLSSCTLHQWHWLICSVSLQQSLNPTAKLWFDCRTSFPLTGSHGTCS